MRNEHLPISEEREAARQYIRHAALFQASVEAIAADEFVRTGQVSPETASQRNEAGQRYNAAIMGMLACNEELR